MGKTIALKGLAHDRDVLYRFPDGVLYMSLGQGATVQTALRVLGIIVTITGGKAIAETLRGSCSLREAVDYAVPRFAGKLCLFLVDDVWPLENCKNGFLMDLRQLLRESPKSRMVISTRSMAIAQCGGSVVRFGARDPLGPVSQKIFMAHATGGAVCDVAADDGVKIRKSVSKILSVCGGLPIVLSVTGAAVAFLTSSRGNFGSACDAYSVQLEKKRSGLGDEDTMEGKSLNAGILLSLEYLEAEFLSLKSKTNLRVEHSISDLYTSLCVLENQGWVSVSVLSRLWRVDEGVATDVVNLLCEMSLATLHWRRPTTGRSEVAGIMLHDLQLDFCPATCHENGNVISIAWSAPERISGKARSSSVRRAMWIGSGNNFELCTSVVVVASCCRRRVHPRECREAFGTGKSRYRTRFTAPRRTVDQTARANRGDLRARK